MKPEIMELADFSRHVSAPPVPGEDSIFLRGLRVHALIGAYAHERHAPQPLVIDLELGLARSTACFSDQLGDAVDYGEVITTVRRIADTNTCKLLEFFAQRLADTLLEDFGLHSVALSVTKPRIFFDSTEAVGVTIRRLARAG